MKRWFVDPQPQPAARAAGARPRDSWPSAPRRRGAAASRSIRRTSPVIVAKEVDHVTAPRIWPTGSSGPIRLSADRPARSSAGVRGLPHSDGRERAAGLAARSRGSRATRGSSSTRTAGSTPHRPGSCSWRTASRVSTPSSAASTSGRTRSCFPRLAETPTPEEAARDARIRQISLHFGGPAAGRRGGRLPGRRVPCPRSISRRAGARTQAGGEEAEGRLLTCPCRFPRTKGAPTAAACHRCRPARSGGGGASRCWRSSSRPCSARPRPGVWYVEALWFDSLGFSSVFWRTLTWKAGLFARLCGRDASRARRRPWAMRPRRLGRPHGLRQRPAGHVLARAARDDRAAGARRRWWRSSPGPTMMERVDDVRPVLEPADWGDAGRCRGGRSRSSVSRSTSICSRCRSCSC